LNLRKESLQWFKVVRIASGYMLFLTIFYLIQSLFCLIYIDEKDFKEANKGAQYATELYEYSVTIEKMKILHALSLASLSFFVVLFTRKFKILNDTHYA